MCLRDELEQGYTGISASAAEHDWRPSPSPSLLPLPHGERKGERGSWRERMVARARNGRRCTVRA